MRDNENASNTTGGFVFLSTREKKVLQCWLKSTVQALRTVGNSHEETINLQSRPPAHLTDTRCANTAVQLLQCCATFVSGRSNKRHYFGISFLWRSKSPPDQLGEKVLSQPSEIFRGQSSNEG